MTCHNYSSENVTLFVCDRLVRATARCKCGARTTKLCDYLLTGAKAGSTCDRPLCARCATSVGDNLDLCEAHVRMTKKSEEG